MKQFSVLILFVCSLGKIYPQVINPVMICDFSDSIPESSGLVYIDSVHVLTHNDSGDSSRLYLYNKSNCTIEREIRITNHIATDFEAITLDDSGYVYIADIGNNLANRHNLAILKIALADILNYDTVSCKKITFNYADQNVFDTVTHNFDCESMLHYNDSLYLFSKNHGVSGGFCKLYRVPDIEGTYSIWPYDSIPLSSWVTDAALSSDKSRFALNSEDELFVFAISGTQISLDPGYATFIYSFITKKEGISFMSDNIILITDEVFMGDGGKLYSIDLTQLAGENENSVINPLDVIVNNTAEEVTIQNNMHSPVSYTFYTVFGQLFNSGIVEEGTSFTTKIKQRGVLLLETSKGRRIIKF